MQLCKVLFFSHKSKKICKNKIKKLKKEKESRVENKSDSCWHTGDYEDFHYALIVLCIWWPQLCPNSNNSFWNQL